MEDTAAYCYVVRAGSAVRTHTAAKLDYRLDAFKEQIDCLVHLAKADPITSWSYASRAIEYPLAPMGLSIRRNAGNDGAAQRFFEDLRQQVLRLPAARDTGSKSVIVQALVEHGIPLASRPYAPAGEAPWAVDWPPIVAEWLRFFSVASHSKLRAQVRTALLVKEALFDLKSGTELAGDDADLEQALAAIRQLLANSRPGGWLFRLDPELALFAAGGPAIILAPKRRIKKLAKRALRR